MNTLYVKDYIVMVAKEGFTKIVNSMNPWVGGSKIMYTFDDLFQYLAHI